MSTWPISTIHLSMPTNDAYQDANSAFKTGLVSISGSQFSLNGAGHTMALATYVLVHLLHTLPSNVYLRTSYILCSKLFTAESTQSPQTCRQSSNTSDSISCKTCKVYGKAEHKQTSREILITSNSLSQVACRPYQIHLSQADLNSVT
jgi:hypothetical protein